MQMIAGIELSPETLRLSGIPCRLIEVDHAVVHPARPDPLVERGSLGFSLDGITRRALEGRERASKNPDSARVGAFDHLPMSGNQIRGAWRRIVHAVPDIVDALQHDDVRDTGLFQNL